MTCRHSAFSRPRQQAPPSPVEWKADRPRRSDSSRHRRGRHRPDIWRPACASSMRRSRRPSRARSGFTVRGAGGGECQGPARRVAANDTLEAVRTYKVANQGTADHAGRRRHPQSQCHAAAGARSLRVRPPGALLHRPPAPVTHPELMNVVKSSAEHRDVYAGIGGARHPGPKGHRVSSSARWKADPSRPGIGIKTDFETRHQAADAHGGCSTRKIDTAGRRSPSCTRATS